MLDAASLYNDYWRRIEESIDWLLVPSAEETDAWHFQLELAAHLRDLGTRRATVRAAKNAARARIAELIQSDPANVAARSNIHAQITRMDDCLQTIATLEQVLRNVGDAFAWAALNLASGSGLTLASRLTAGVRGFALDVAQRGDVCQTMFASACGRGGGGA